MITGYLIGESLRPGAAFEPRGLRLRKVSRVDASATATAGQPALWTFVEWEADGDDIAGLAEAFAAALEPALGWYVDFDAGDERVVVFAGKVFRYLRGDAAGRAEAIAYGRSAGTPEHQLDWKE
ncbi:hypothetical protein [Streptomyces bicolor]|uniref:hypothetical protein n=1 Tax=Streptomyces bicolor TaxID=66874 RepID=UPI0004E0DF14|nr:hypothetical protein [Streptomyces bicolor]